MIFSVVPLAFAEYEDTIIVMETEIGRLIIEFFPESAPNHVKNFITLSEDGFYTGTIFHRIIEGFMIQGGDPKTAVPGILMSEWGTGDPGYSIDAEFNNIQHKRGIVSMARSSDPNSAGSQFFIVHKDSNFLDGQYTVFGRILTDESFETLDRLATLKTGNDDIAIDVWKAIIHKVNVIDRSEISNLPELDIPETFEDESTLVAPTTSQFYDFSEYGISFTGPAGWLVQTPTPTSSTTPDILILGSKTSTSEPAVAITISRDSSSLESSIQDVREQITPLLNTGALTISSETATQINGKNAYVLNAIGHFENRDGIEKKVGFSNILIKVDEMLYSIQYSNNIESYEKHSNEFFAIVDSMEFSDIESMKVPVGSESSEEGYSGTNVETQEGDGGGCLIATAAYGSEMAPQVQFLREIRDNTVMNTQSGTAFMTGFNQFYYSFSPQIADYERENPVFKEAVKVTLTPLLTSLTLLNYVEIDSEEEMLGYGIGTILLNVGMYFVAPAVLVISVKKVIFERSPK